jgi:hypothetical protein
MLKMIGKGLAAITIVAGSFWVTLILLGPMSSQQADPNRVAKVEPREDVPPSERDFDEKLYLAVNPDVTAAIARGEFSTAYQHYQLAGFAEHRLGASVPSNWNEAEYLRVNPDVAAAIKAGAFISGYHHWLEAGRNEGRHGGFPGQTAIR